jgi:16S rRNA U516 pseudouridylate synthase RsuA-like enzyme
MFGAVGMPIERLVRVRIGPLRIDGLRTGRVRPLTTAEVARLAAGSDPGGALPMPRPPSPRRVSSR